MNKEYAQYLQERNKEGYDKIADDFSQTRLTERRELKQFNRFIKKGDFLLDIGCGNGQLIDALREKEISYIGIDSSPRLIKIAQQRYPRSRFVTGDIFKVTFPSETFNGVFAISLLHHIPSLPLQLRLLKEATRVLRPSGLLFLTVWQIPLPLSRFGKPSFLHQRLAKKPSLGKRDFIHQWGGQVNLYYHAFTQRELKKLIRETNLSIVDSGEMSNTSGSRKNLYLVAQK
jgi:ubiquinone/menaquinone biosynthesis C-methylase UbiE